MFHDHDSLALCQAKLWQLIHQGASDAVKKLLEKLMEYERDLLVGCPSHERSAARACYRNGYEERGLDTRFGPLRLRKPRVRSSERPFQSMVFDRYQRRQRELEDSVLFWVSAGLSTRDAARAFERIFEGILSPGSVSSIVAELDNEIRAFHIRPLRHGYRYVFFDAKCGYSSYPRRRRGRGKKKPGALLLAWGIRHSGPEELIDFRLVDKENEQNWTDFMTDLEERGLKIENPWSQRLDMIISDGDGGLLAALYMVYPTVPKQRCIFHKIQDITDHLLDQHNRKAILSEASAIYQDLQRASPRPKSA